MSILQCPVSHYHSLLTSMCAPSHGLGRFFTCFEPLIFLLVNDTRRCFWPRRWIPSPQCYSAMWIPEFKVYQARASSYNSNKSTN